MAIRQYVEVEQRSGFMKVLSDIFHVCARIHAHAQREVEVAGVGREGGREAGWQGRTE